RSARNRTRSARNKKPTTLVTERIFEFPLQNLRRLPLGLFWLALALSWSVGILGRGYWTPDEPREADISWRMSWQAEKAVPLLAGEAFCEKPPLTYWVAGAAIGVLGADAWAAR